MSLLQEYNGRDCIATFQLWQVMQQKLADDGGPGSNTSPAQEAYDESMALSSPMLYAMLRGIRVDPNVFQSLKAQFDRECRALEAQLDSVTKPLLNAVINIGSSDQVQWMFGCLNAEIDSSDTEHLEQLAKGDPAMAPLCNIILEWRDRNKMLSSVLKDDLIDADGRVRTTYKVGGTVTRRLSSSKNALWTGMNMQNIKRDQDESKTGHASIRSMFIADPGFTLLNIDLERADSWAVALEVYQFTGDRSYLDACSGADLHTTVSQLVWPNLGWTGNPSKDKEIAEGFFYRQYDYRFMSKKAGHGSNYLGSAWALAMQMKVPLKLVQAFQHAYFQTFQGIQKWHRIKARELQTTACLTNLLGIRRRFHSRLDSDSTLKEAIAYLGQSVTAEVINRGIIALWALMCRRPDLNIQFLAQVHDSALIQIPEENLYEAIPLIKACFRIPLSATWEEETITAYMPLEVKVGWNWAGLQKDRAGRVYNVDGIVKLKEGQRDTRTRTKAPFAPVLRVMDKRLSGSNRKPLKPALVPEVECDHGGGGEP